MSEQHSKSVKRHNGGQAAIIFGLALIPLTLVMTMALDAWRQVSVDRHVQNAADMAAMAGARAFATTTSTTTDIETITLASFNQNLDTAHGDVSCDAVNIDVNETDHTVTVDADCAMPTILGGGLFSPDEMQANADAVAGAYSSTLELALILDISNSMGGSDPGSSTGETKLETMRSAAASLINKLVTNASGEDARVSIIPFALTVNADIYGNAALGRPLDDDRHADGVDTVCVTERLGAEAFTDADPTSGAYIGQHYSMWGHCQTSGVQVQPLSNDGTSLATYVSNLPLGGSATAGHIGLAWGWYSLSPSWSSIWPDGSDPVAYGLTNQPKVAVLLTDGVFNFATSHHTQGSSLQQGALLCQAMKDEGIIIYTIAYDLAVTDGTDFLRACATDADHYFDASNSSDLDEAFAAVAARFLGTNLRE